VRLLGAKKRCCARWQNSRPVRRPLGRMTRLETP
jgi:hypothetical protein